jgi:hypothetical protein
MASEDDAPEFRLVMELDIRVTDEVKARAYLLGLEKGPGIEPLRKMALGDSDAVTAAEEAVMLRLADVVYAEQASMGLQITVQPIRRREPDEDGRYPELVLGADPSR